MNIFYLHKKPEVSARLHCDKHVVKMIIEYAQMLSTAQLEPGQTIRYRIENDELLDESQVITKLSEKNPYIEWVNSKPLEVDQTFNEEKDNAIDVESLSDFYE